MTGSNPASKRTIRQETFTSPGNRDENDRDTFVVSLRQTGKQFEIGDAHCQHGKALLRTIKQRYGSNMAMMIEASSLWL